jgi:hypothetical protein
MRTNRAAVRNARSGPVGDAAVLEALVTARTLQHRGRFAWHNVPDGVFPD